VVEIVELKVVVVMEVVVMEMEVVEIVKLKVVTEVEVVMEVMEIVELKMFVMY